MEKFFSLPRLQKPSLIGLLTLHYIYIIAPKRPSDTPNNVKTKYRVRVDQIKANIYILDEVDEKDSTTGQWIQMTHEDFINNWTIIEAVTSREKLTELSVSMDLKDFKL